MIAFASSLRPRWRNPIKPLVGLRQWESGKACRLLPGFGRRPGGGEQVSEPLHWNSRTEQIALHLVASEFAQNVPLLFGLHTFSRGGHAARHRHVNDRFDDRGRALSFGDVVNKAAVDLHLVERKTTQITQ